MSNATTRPPVRAPLRGTGGAIVTNDDDRRNIVLFLARNVLFSCAGVLVTGTVLLTYMTAIGLDGARIGLYAGFTGAVQIAAYLFLAGLADRTGRVIRFVSLYTALFCLFPAGLALLRFRGAMAPDMLSGLFLALGVAGMLATSLRDLYEVKLPYLVIAPLNLGRVSSVNGLPAAPPASPFIAIDRVWSPRVELRNWRVFGDFPPSGEAWSLRQQLDVLAQAVKLRLNGLWFGMASMHAFIDVEVDGIRRRTAAFFYGLPVPVDEDNVGFEQLYRTDSYVGPDFRASAGNYRAMHAAMKQYATAILDRAKFFEMTVTMPIDVFTYCPEFAPALEHPKVNQQIGDPFVYEGGDLLGAKSLRMIEAHWNAYLATYPQVDVVILGVPEFGRGAGCFEQAWASLRRRLPAGTAHDPAWLFGRAAVGNVLAGGQQRSADEAKVTIVLMATLYRLIDHFGWIEELGRQGKRLGWNAGLTCPQLLPLLADLMWDDGVLVTIFGYTASRSLRALRFLDGIHRDRLTVGQYLTLQDDNTGYLPQLCDTAVADLVEGGLAAGLSAFYPRFYPIVDLDSTFHLLTDICWDAAMTPERSFLRFAGRLYGEANARLLLRAKHLMETATAFLDMRMGLLFPFDKAIESKLGPGLRNMGRPDGLLYHMQALYRETLHVLDALPAPPPTAVGSRRLACRAARILFAILVFDWLERVDLVNAALDRGDPAAACVAYAAARPVIPDALRVVAENLREDGDRGALAYYYHAYVRRADARFEELVGALPA